MRIVEEKRTKFIKVRVTEDEYNRLKFLSIAADLSLSDLIRGSLLTKFDQIISESEQNAKRSLY